MKRTPLGSIAAYCDGVRAGQRRMVAKTITLLESTHPEDRAVGEEVLEALVPFTGGALRVGVTGSPGVGKSCFIEALGLHILAQGHRLAVLAVDPSSPLTGGSILGDKTRMERLALEERAFIRPSPSGGALGGVAQRTREALLVCEAAGFDVVLVETVGVGQSEVSVASMVDFFAVLLQPGAGDGLQGIKKGVIELADGLLVTKADGALSAHAEQTRCDYAQALHLLRPSQDGWSPPVLAVSSRSGTGLAAFWEAVLAHRAMLSQHGALEAKRQRQALAWMWSLVEEGLLHALHAQPSTANRIETLEREVLAKKITPAAAARSLLATLEPA